MEVELRFVEEALELFPTRVVHRRFTGVDRLNARLRQLILAREASHPGVRRSNVSGWHSESDFLRWGAPECAALAELFRGTAQRCVALELDEAEPAPGLRIGLEAWANVARSGSFTAPHVHPRANLAMVYYVDVGEPPPEGAFGGYLELLDPRNRVQMVGGPGTDERDAFRIRPFPGSLIAFPAWLYHYVHPYQGQRPRICVACNAVITGPAPGPLP